MGLTNAERQARWRESREQRIKVLERRVAELEQDKPLRNGDGGSPAGADGKRVAELQARVEMLKQSLSVVGGRALAYEAEIERLKAAAAGASPNRQLHRLMDRATYRQLLAHLHPDRVQDEDAKQRASLLFAAVNNMEAWLTLSEAEEDAKWKKAYQAKQQAAQAQRDKEAAAKRKAKRDADKPAKAARGARA
jgi:hypothetical protein